MKIEEKIAELSIEARVSGLCATALDFDHVGATQTLTTAAQILVDWQEKHDELPECWAYTNIVMSSHMNKATSDDLVYLKSWNLPDSYWTELVECVPAGSITHRRVCAQAAQSGHAKAIAYVVGLNRHSGSTASRMDNQLALKELKKTPRDIRKVAGMLAPMWTGTLAELTEAAREFTPVPAKQ